MTDHMPMPKVSRLEVVSTGARRRWTLEEKQRILTESYGGSRLVSVTARRNGLSTSQLFTWRRLAREGKLSGHAAPVLVPVEITPTAAPISSGAPQPMSSPPAHRARAALSRSSLAAVVFALTATSMLRRCSGFLRF
ncbi:transposase [Bradyrhizobium sp. IC3069]|nr:transposase [Bradyrhizobium sp. IC4059]MCA1520896.1 transposase [Bradyrhizobium sp. IC3069]